MADTRNDGWKIDTPTYTEEQIEGVLTKLGLYIESSTWSEYLLNCPFHGGRDTPSFAVQKTSGVYFCFNPSCNVTGTVITLIKSISKCSDYEAARMVLMQGKAQNLTPLDKLKRAQEKQQLSEEYVEFPQAQLDKMYDYFWLDQKSQDYMKSRGFDEDTLHHFRIGYSIKKDLITVPMHSPDGVPVGIIGRRPSATDKVFKNSIRLPTSRALWNFHRAKRQGDTLIICEASFDAMRIHQAGYPNVVALLMGHCSQAHFDLISRSFSRIIIMTDFDKKKFWDNCRKCSHEGLNLCRGHNPGRDLGRKIVAGLPGKQIFWASYENTIVYPHGAKDAGDLTDVEIRQCIKNAVPNIEYSRWGLD